MRLYDTEGKLVVNVAFPPSDIVINVTNPSNDKRYWRKNVDDIIDGQMYGFSNTASNFRLNGGKVQIKDLVTGNWYTIRLDNSDDGQVNLVIVETPDATSVVSEDLTNHHFWRADVSDIIDGSNYGFSVAGSTFRWFNGCAQIKNNTSGLWHTINIVTGDDSGPVWSITEVGIATAVTTSVIASAYWRRDVDDIIDGQNYQFSPTGNNFRIYAGKAQIQNDTTKLWHTLALDNSDDGGVNWLLTVVGIA